MISNTPGFLYGYSAGFVLNIPAAVRMNGNLKTKLLEVKIKKTSKINHFSKN